MEDKVTEAQPFQYQYRRFYTFFAIAGSHAPGLIAFPSLISKILVIYSYFPFSLGLTHLFFMAYGFSTVEMSDIRQLVLIRRTIMYGYATSKIASIIFRRKQLLKLIEAWNFNQHLDNYAHLRKQTLNDKMRLARNFFWACLIFYVMLPQVFIIQLILDPYGIWTQDQWFPHNLNSPYHLIYCFLHWLITTLIGVGGVINNTITLHLLLMISTEAHILTERLKSILKEDPTHNLKTSTEQQNRARYDGVEIELKEWLAAHIRTIRWGQEVRNFLVIENSCKYTFVGSYAALLSFTSLHMINDGHAFEAGILVTLMLAIFSIYFISTSVADQVASQMENLFKEAYGPEIFNHSRSVQKMITTIATNCNSRPIRFKFWSIFEDNAETFLSILVLAYRGFTFLLHSQSK